MHKNTLFFAVLVTLLGLNLSLSGPAAAQVADSLGKSGEWDAFQLRENGRTVCFIGSEPTDAKGNYTRRGDIYVQVTHRPAENTFDVVSIETGYTYRSGSEVTVAIGGETFNLFVNGSNAFAYNADDDRALVNAMKRGSTMVVKGTSSRGTATTDTYSLSGFTKSYNTIGGVCR